MLFQPGGWFAIDADNHKVAGVRPGTLDQALALVGLGAVATIVGSLRPEVTAVDIDAGGTLGDLAADTLRDWCAARGLWHLVRPSGGAPGRWHLLTVPGVHRPAFDDFIAQVRRELGLGQKKLDDRTQLRPLSAPHRTAGHTPLPHALDDVLLALQQVLEPLPAATAKRRALQPTPPRTAAGPDAPLNPLHRARRELPTEWQTYLARGRRDVDDRSQLELEATTQLVIAGYTEQEAWNAITAAHPAAFTKARSRGRRWWWNVWNRCVHNADAWLTARRRTQPGSPEPLAATQAARVALDAAWLDWPARTRHTDAEVLSVVLSRMDRVSATAVAIPQRDLVLDCAVGSRTTVRASLRRLIAAGLLDVDATYQPGTTDTAHTLRLPPRFADPHGSDGDAVSVTGPSRSQPPQHPAPLPLRRALGLPATAVLQHLPPPSAPALAAPHLAHAAGLLDAGQAQATPRQLRTLRGHLQRLAQHGLAVVDETGCWRAVAHSPGSCDVERLGQLLQDDIAASVAHERAEFRALFDVELRRAKWERQRHVALAAAAKAARARQKAWWSAASPGERDSRRTDLSARFEALAPVERARMKHELARRRAIAGDNERARYDEWFAQLDADVLGTRCVERALAYARLPRHHQQQLVAGWAEHRARWGLPHHRLPTTPGSRPESVLLRRTRPTIEELVLFDASHLANVRVRPAATA